MLITLLVSLEDFRKGSHQLVFSGPFRFGGALDVDCHIPLMVSTR